MTCCLLLVLRYLVYLLQVKSKVLFRKKYVLRLVSPLFCSVGLYAHCHWWCPPCLIRRYRVVLVYSRINSKAKYVCEVPRDIKMYVNATPQHSSYTAATSPDANLVLGLHARREFRPRHPRMQPGRDRVIVIAEVVLVGRPPQLGHQELAPEARARSTPRRSSTRRHLAYETASCAHARPPEGSTYEHASTKPPKPRSTRPYAEAPAPQQAAAMVSLSYLILSISQAGNLIFHRGVNIPSWCTWPSPVREIRYSITVHEAAAVVESGGDAGDAVAIRRRLRGGEGPVGMLGGGGPARMPVCCRAPRV